MPTGKKVDPQVAEKLMLKAGLKTLEAYKNSDSPWRSECLKCHREVSPTYSNIRLGKASCAYCSGRRVDLNEALQLLSSKNLEPVEPFATVMKPWKCKCLICGDLVSPSLNSLKRGQGGCIRCGYKNAKRYKVDTARAIDLMVKAGVKPLEEYHSRVKPWKSKCLKCGNIVNPRLSSIMAGQGPCGYCAGFIVDEAKIIEQMIKQGLKPLEPYVAARKKWKCECLTCGQIVTPMFNSIQQGQFGCKDCGIKRASDKKTFTQEEAKDSMLEAGFEPLEPYVHSETKWKVRCQKCKKICYPTLHNAKMGSGCPSCAKSGFDPNEDGFLYFLQHEIWEMLQIGITNNPDKRLNQHRKLGWELLEIRGPMDGHLTQNWETGMLRYLKAVGADLSNSKIVGKFDGYSEAWSKSTFPVNSIKELMRLTEEFEKKKGAKK
jgi:hypothetical protein